MSNAIARQIRMLQLIPKHPSKTTVQKIFERLEAEQLGVEERTIQRHLDKLRDHFPIEGDGGKPQGWRWIAGAAPIQMPMVDAGTALTYTLVKEYLDRLLPRALSDQLDSQFSDVHRVLGSPTGRKFKRWSERVALLPFGPDRRPVTIEASVLPAVYLALLEGRQLQVHYRSGFAEKPNKRILHPLGLVGVDDVMYLIAVADGYTDPRQWALHRMSHAEVRDVSVVEPPTFSLGDYIHQERGFQYPSHGAVRLELRVHPFVARLLEERPLSADQQRRVIPGSDEVRIIARVEFTEQLRWWLRSHGATVEVLKPLAIRREFARESAEIAGRYRKA